MTTIYKKDTKGKIRQLCILQSVDNLFQQSGIVGGKLVTHIKPCKGKNIGRANETTPEQQCKFEVEALIKKKLREGYFTTVAEAESEEIVLPMLAHSYEKHSRKVDWGNAFVQPKLDGMRCLAFVKDGKVKLMSRKGVEITTMNHIALSLSGKITKDMILDGELYAHGETFQKNMSLIKKYREGESEEVMFHVYDVVDNNPYIVRNKQFLTIDELDYIEVVPTASISCEVEMFDMHTKYLQAGYEGTMLRHGIKGYKKNGRADQLLKVKDFIDETFTVTNILPMEAYTDQGMVVCSMGEGKSFTATPKMSHEDKRELLKNKDDYIGQTAEIRFFEYTDDGFPRFPICVGFRLDK